MIRELTEEEYLELITAFHRGKPKFTATVGMLTSVAAGISNFIQNLPVDFDLDEAVGAQLDVVGEWVGRSRRIPVPINGVFFSFDDELRGFDLGVWRREFEDQSGIVILDDDTYRTLLRAKIAANHWNGQLATAKSALELVFNSSTGSRLILTDNLNMTMTIGVAGKIPSILLIVLLSRGYIPVRPSGVEPNYTIVTVDGAPLMGFDVQNEFISGFDSGAWGAVPSYFTGA